MPANLLSRPDKGLWVVDLLSVVGGNQNRGHTR